ncbi:DUF2933 domain-containing protein [Azospira restricta]|nr:DUF2933 domain-containing protein [Azospira restricta]
MERTPEQPPPEVRRAPPAARGKWVFIGFAAVAIFFLLTEHRAHLFGILPYLLLAACPLMHLFHHHGHGGHAGHAGHRQHRRRDDDGGEP